MVRLRIARGDLAEEIAALKSESGGDIIMVHGGAAFVQALSRLGLIDEYRLIILPVALGNGLPLFKDLANPLRVELAEAKSFPDGTALTRAHVDFEDRLQQLLSALITGFLNTETPMRESPTEKDT
jgi:dihydrofolate reductase